MFRHYFSRPTNTLNSAIGTFTLVFIGVIGGAVLSVTPELVKSLIGQLGFSPQQAGSSISAELGGMALATFPALYWIKACNWRAALLVSILIIVLGNLASCVFQSHSELLIIRALTGLGAGSAMIVCLAGISQTNKPEPVYGLWVAGQLIFTTIGLMIFPKVIPQTGLEIIFIVVSVMAVLLVLFIPNIPTSAAAQQEEQHQAQQGNTLAKILGWVSVFIFYIGIIAVWVFAKIIGESFGYDSTDISTALAASGLVGLVAAVAATAIGDKLGFLKPVTVGILIGVVGLYLILIEPNYLLFAIGICLFHFTWNFVLPYLLAILATLDDNGQLMALANLAIGSGLSVGPLIAGHFVESSGLIAPIWMSMGLLMC